MGNEIDRLEIVVEAEASKANRNLAKMEKRITNIANALDKLGALSGALGNVGNVDFGEYEKASKNIDELLGKSKKSHNTDATPRINKADIKYAAKTAEELQKKFPASVFQKSPPLPSTFPHMPFSYNCQSPLRCMSSHFLHSNHLF